MKAVSAYKDFDFGFPAPATRKVDGFADLTDLLGPGVYVLERAGAIVYIAWATAVLERLAKHRELVGSDLPSWFPVRGITFDRFHFRRCASDIGESIVAELISKHRPYLNEPSNASSTST